MILNELYEMVNKDLEIDKTELDTESLRTPQIHNKYLILHSKEKLKLEHVLSEKKVKRRDSRSIETKHTVDGQTDAL